MEEINQPSVAATLSRLRWVSEPFTIYEGVELFPNRASLQSFQICSFHDRFVLPYKPPANDSSSPGGEDRGEGERSTIFRGLRGGLKARNLIAWAGASRTSGGPGNPSQKSLKVCKTVTSSPTLNLNSWIALTTQKSLPPSGRARRRSCQPARPCSMPGRREVLWSAVALYR
jgi:hypothetical protein